MLELWQIALAMGGVLVSGGAVYGGIRAELRSMHERQMEQGRTIAQMQLEGCGPCRGRRRDD